MLSVIEPMKAVSVSELGFEQAEYEADEGSSGRCLWALRALCRSNADRYQSAHMLTHSGYREAISKLSKRRLSAVCP